MSAIQRFHCITIKADKGGAVVIMAVGDYIEKANRQLNDNNNYEQLDFDPTWLRNEKLNSEIKTFENETSLPQKQSTPF